MEITKTNLDGVTGYFKGVLGFLRSLQLFLPLTHVEEWRYSSTILDLSTRWRLVFGSTIRPLYPGEIALLNSSDRRPSEPKSRY
jgi:hypothetical protein